MNQEMNTETLEALEASIAKWEGNAVAQSPEEYTLGSNSCKLCRKFFDYGCDGCPVAWRTGRSLCVGSPYEAAREAWYDWAAHDTDEARAAAHAAARDEVEFLRSLLPKVQP